MKSLEDIRAWYLRWCVVPTLRWAGPRTTTVIAQRIAAGVFDLNLPSRPRGMRRLLDAVREGGLKIRNEDATGFLCESYRQYGRFWAESLFLQRRLTVANWRRYVACESEARFQSLAKDERGCLIAVAYHGNIAAAAIALGHAFRPLHVVMDASMLPSRGVWRPLISRLRNVRIIERGDAGREIPRVLESGGAVMIVAENERVRGRGVPVRFMGRRFEAYPTIGRLAAWFDTPVAVVSCPRGSAPFGFELKLHDVIDPRDISRNDGTTLANGDDIGIEMTKRTMAALERGVLESPEQYLWFVPTPDAAVAKVTTAKMSADSLAYDSGVCRQGRSDGAELPRSISIP